MYQGALPTPPRLSGVWDAVRTRLSGDGVLQGLLGGAGRVTLSWAEDAYVGPEASQWARVVIVPVVRAYPVENEHGATVLAPFLVRADAHLPGDGSTLEKLELIQIRVFELLSGWLPAGLPADVQVRHHIYRASTPEPIPIYDPESDTDFLSAEYRVLAESPDT